MKKLLSVVCILGLIVTNQPKGATELMTWVGAGAGSTCYNNLASSHGGVNPKDVFTMVGVQFWMPNSDGTLSGPSDAATLTNVVTWAGSTVKVLLTVYNADGTGTNNWNWDRAVGAFRTGSKFANALVDAAKQYGLDGIDLDLEGYSVDPSGEYRNDFKNFVSTLSTTCKANNLLLTICTTGDIQESSEPNNVPNTDWWQDWVGKVDYIHSMLYGEGGDKGCEGNTANDDQYWYSTQQKIGTDFGYPKEVISMGLPSYDDGNWQSNATTHLDQCYNIAASISIWDMQLRNGSWQSSSDIWNKLKSFRNIVITYKLTLSPGTGGTITANPNQSSYAQGTKVTLTATPNSGYTFAGWGGALSGSTNPGSVTMDANKTVSATFTSNGGKTFDMLANGSWDTASDDYGSKITITNTTNIAASWTLAKAPTDTSYPWVSLSATADGAVAGAYTPLTAVKVTYTSSHPLIISLNQTGLAELGESYMAILPTSSSAKTMTLNVDTSVFHQPDWVEKPSALNLAKVIGLDFSPGVDASPTSTITGNFTITECTLFGVEFAITGIAPSTVSSSKMAVRAINGNLTINGLTGAAFVTMYDIAGRLLVARTNINVDKKGTMEIRLTKIASQTAFVRIENGVKVETVRVPLQF